MSEAERMVRSGMLLTYAKSCTSFAALIATPFFSSLKSGMRIALREDGFRAGAILTRLTLLTPGTCHTERTKESNMKKLVYLFVLALCFTGTSLQATTIFSENFDALTPQPAVSSAGQFHTINGTNIDIVGGSFF